MRVQRWGRALRVTWLTGIVFLINMIFGVGGSLAGAFFVGTIEIDPFPNAPLDVFLAGTSDGFAFMAGNATANETHSKLEGTIRGASDLPFGIAAAESTGNVTATMTNDTANPVDIDSAFRIRATLGTGIAGPGINSAGANFDLHFDSEFFGFKGGEIGPVSVANNDPPFLIDRTFRVVDTLEPDQMADLELSFRLAGFATTVSEPATLPLLGICLAVLAIAGSRTYDRNGRIHRVKGTTTADHTHPTGSTLAYCLLHVVPLAGVTTAMERSSKAGDGWPPGTRSATSGPAS